MRKSTIRAGLLPFLLPFPLLAACSGNKVSGVGSDGGPPTPTGGGALDGGTGGGGPPTPAPFGLDQRPANPSCVAPARPQASTTVRVVPAFDGLTFNGPTDMKQAPGDPSRWYVVEKAGVVRVFANDDATTTSSVFIDITSEVNSGPNEAGLLSMAFHPDFATNRTFFLSYTAPSAASPVNLRSQVARFTVRADGTADPASEAPIMPPTDDGAPGSPGVLDQPYENHNGGNLVFGPDGYLYYGLGDGGNGGDPQNRAQNLRVFFGKMLRIDVDHVPAGKRYGIPADNPFAGGGAGLPELFAWGLRNPWRFSFDRATGDFWVGDVGQDTWEEIDKLELGGNYGWREREGAHCYNPPNNCQTGGLIDPIVEYNHNGAGRSVTGGYIYRGSAIPSLVGHYLYADEVTGDLFTITYDPAGKPKHTLLLNIPGASPASFGEGADGELYLVDYGRGKLLKIVPASTTTVTSTFPERLSATGCVDPTDATRPASGMIPYDVNMPLWSDGAGKARWFALPDGTQIHVKADGDWDLPVGSVAMKQFSVGGRLVETRLLMHHPDGVWAGYSYEWNDAGTDATLLPAGKTKMVGGQKWTFPSRSDCLVCHTAAAGRTLGLENLQLNRTAQYGSRIANQLATLDHVGLFDAPIGDPAGIPALASLTATAAATRIARSYLHANCSFCHRPGGMGQGPQDFLFSVGFADMKVCNAQPQEGDLGVMGARLFVPGAPERSLISLRMRALDANRMPPLATTLVDTQGNGAIDQWIRTSTGCP